eukprot:PhF_6_TR36612/c0_g1_i1/m.54035
MSNFEEQYALALECKQKGTALFKEGNFQKASFHYQMIYMHIGYYIMKNENPFAAMVGHLGGGEGAAAAAPSTTISPEQTAKAISLLVDGYNNAVLCCVNLKNYKKACEIAKKVLAMDPNNAKARLRRCTALIQMGDFDGAQEDNAFLKQNAPQLLQGIDFDKEIAQAMAQEQKSQSAMYRNMFS